MPPTSTDIPESPEPRVGLAAPVARAVAEDLESLFPQDPGPRSTADRRLRLGRQRSGATAGGRSGIERRAATLGAVLAAALAGVSAGALFSRSAPSARSSTAERTFGAPIQVSVPMLPSPGPLAPLPSAAAQELPAVTAPVLKVLPEVAPEVAPEAPHKHAPALRKVSAHGHAAVRRHKLTRVATNCGGHERCGHATLMAADARLRRAYASAARAGVARQILVDYRDEWGRLRERGPREPGMVAARYRQMAGELDSMAEGRWAKPAEPHVGPWRRFRTQLAALWR